MIEHGFVPDGGGLVADQEVLEAVRAKGAESYSEESQKRGDAKGGRVSHFSLRKREQAGWRGNKVGIKW